MGADSRIAALGGVFAAALGSAGVVALTLILDWPAWISLAALTLGTAVTIWSVWVAQSRLEAAVGPIRDAVRELRSGGGAGDGTGAGGGMGVGVGEWGMEALPRQIAARGSEFVLELEGARRAGATLSAVLEALELPVFATDSAGVVVLLNRAAGAFAGVRPERALGRPIDEVLTYADVLRLHNSATSGTAIHQEVRLTRAQGACILDVWARKIPGLAAGGDGLTLLVLRDVTEAARSAHMQQDFVANASHELRTPIAAMRVAIDTLDAIDADDHESRARFMGIITSNIDRLEEMIRDLLDLSKLQSTESAPEIEEVAASQIAATLSPPFERACAERKLTLTWDLAPELERMQTDRKLLLLVLQNLIENATKFAYEGTEVRVVGREMRGRDEGVTGIRLEVRDRGIGIPLNQQGRIFERFYQVDAARSGVGGSRRGTGLGLAIALHAAKRLGGSIRVQSVWKEGTTMIVELPTARTAPEPQAGAA